jgi:hypothetical protein
LQCILGTKGDLWWLLNARSFYLAKEGYKGPLKAIMISVNFEDEDVIPQAAKLDLEVYALTSPLSVLMSKML